MGVIFDSELFLQAFYRGTSAATKRMGGTIVGFGRQKACAASKIDVNSYLESLGCSIVIMELFFLPSGSEV